MVNFEQEKAKVGIIGTGFIGSGLAYSLECHRNVAVSAILTRRNPSEIKHLPPEKVTDSLQQIIEESDVVVECSGDPLYATDSVYKILQAGKRVISMNAEMQVTSGSWLSQRGYLTEAEGDQPGSLAALREEVLEMGFDPIVYGNIKGFLNHTPTREEMEFWSKRQGISLEQVTSFTDGTKIQIEQALVANGLGARIGQRGMYGISTDGYQEGGKLLGEKAEEIGAPISDYVLSPKSPAGVFITATHPDERQASYLAYYKMGGGPHYVFLRPFHLCHLEIIKTIERVLGDGGILLNNGKNPTVSVATVAKRPLKKEEIIKRGIGSFDVRGEAVEIKDAVNHLPIGLVFDVKLKYDIAQGATITFGDVEIPESMALLAWKETINNSERTTTSN